MSVIVATNIPNRAQAERAGERDSKEPGENRRRCFGRLGRERLIDERRGTRVVFQHALIMMPDQQSIAIQVAPLSLCKIQVFGSWRERA